MSGDKRSIFAIALCVAFYIAYTKYLGVKYEDAEGQKVTAPVTGSMPATGTSETLPGSSGQATTPTTAPESAPILLSPQDLQFENDTSRYSFSQVDGGLTSAVLKSYKSSPARDAAPINVLDSLKTLQGTVSTGSARAVKGVFHAERTGRTLKFWRTEGPWRITTTYTVPEKGYGMPVQVTFTNQSGQAQELSGGLLSSETLAFKKTKGALGLIPGTIADMDHLAYDSGDDSEKPQLEKFCKDGAPVDLAGRAMKYVGIDRHYFLNVILPRSKTSSMRLEKVQGTEDSCEVAILSYDKYGQVSPGDSISVNYDLYLGPKDAVIMREFDPAIEGTISLGWFGFIAKPLDHAISGFQSLTGNYGVAIVLMTILLKILFYPLVKASSVSMHKMKKLNPEMQAIRERYKDDRQKQQQEIMKFMMQHRINPMKGCLPILPQIPVFFAFYQVLQTSIHLRHAPFFGWIGDLSAMDPWFVTPLLLGVAMFFQQKLTPTTGMDKTQEKILMFMPVIFTVMMLTLPAGLTLYMLTNTVVGIGQQRWLYSKLDKSQAA